MNEEDLRPAEVCLLSGLAGAQKLEAPSVETGLFAKFASFGRDNDYVEAYRQALLEGESVLAVAIKDEHMRDHVTHVLKSQGARLVVFFGRFAVEVAGKLNWGCLELSERGRRRRCTWLGIFERQLFCRGEPSLHRAGFESRFLWVLIDAVLELRSRDEELYDLHRGLLRLWNLYWHYHTAT